jgi:hypothetical protein
MLGSKINQIDPAQRSILASQDVRNKLSSADQLELMALLNALPSRDFEAGKAKLFFADLAVLQIDVAGLGLKFGRYLKIKKPMDSALQKVSPVQLQVLGLVAFYEIAQSPAIVSRSGSALEFAEVVARSGNAGATVASAPIDNFLARAGVLEKANVYIESMTVR